MAKKEKSSIPDKVLKIYEEMFQDLEGVERKGATMPYTSSNGHMFSFLDAHGTLSLRLPREPRESFIKKHKTALAEAHGTVLKEYVLVPGKLFKDSARMKEYFKESYAYIQTLKPKPTGKTAAKKATRAKQEKPGSPKASNVNPKVGEFIQKKNNPLTAEIRRVREIILQTSDKVQEDIKWSAPTFMYKGNIASFFMNAKRHVSLMFHYGASLPNRSGLLEGDAATGRLAKFTDMNDVEKKKKALESVIKEWIELKDAK